MWRGLVPCQTVMNAHLRPGTSRCQEGGEQIPAILDTRISQQQKSLSSAQGQISNTPQTCGRQVCRRNWDLPPFVKAVQASQKHLIQSVLLKCYPQNSAGWALAGFKSPLPSPASQASTNPSPFFTWAVFTISKTAVKEPSLLSLPAFAVQ